MFTTNKFLIKFDATSLFIVKCNIKVLGKYLDLKPIIAYGKVTSSA